MGVRLKAVVETPWKTVDLGDGGSFEVSLRRPTFDELVTDQALEQRAWFESESGAALEARIQNRLELITGWKDVEGSDGKPLPFSKENLRAVCVQLGAMRELLAIASQSFVGLQETEAKNSEGLSSGASVETAGEKTSTTSQPSPDTPAS